VSKKQSICFSAINFVKAIQPSENQKQTKELLLKIAQYVLFKYFVCIERLPLFDEAVTPKMQKVRSEILSDCIYSLIVEIKKLYYYYTTKHSSLKYNLMLSVS
jgi:hypothetical protein